MSMVKMTFDELNKELSAEELAELEAAEKKNLFLTKTALL